MAPELNDVDEDGKAEYDQRVDVYALGVLMEMKWK